MRSVRLNLDALGMCASTLCLLHCLALPLLLAALPMWTLSATQANRNANGQPATADTRTEGEIKSPNDYCDHEGRAAATVGSGEGNVVRAGCCSTPTDFWVHVGLLTAIVPLGVVAWGAGYHKHRRLGVLGLGLAGVFLLSGALLFGPNLLGGRGEQVMTVTGSICMVSAHLWNRRQCRCCRKPDLSRVVEFELSLLESPGVPLTDRGVS